LENSYTAPDQNVNILDEENQSLVQASSGKRFGNYLIDRILIYILWRIFFATIGSRFVLLMVSDSDTTITLWFKIYLMVVLTDLFLYTAIEYLGRGKTIGKLITGTRAVNEDGTYISLKTALLRSLSRMIPFEPFSALGATSYPWHDRWTKTYVVDDKQSRLPEQEA
jgi:uncharacterized RDD family membrane protein YckC